MGHGGINLLGGQHLLKALGLDNQGLFEQLGHMQEQMEVLQELSDHFQMASGALSPHMLASLLQNGGIAPQCAVPPPSMGRCGCPHQYAQPQQFDLGASGGSPFGPNALFARMQGAMFERMLSNNPFARAQFEMAVGGRIIQDGVNDGRITVQPFPQGAFPGAGGAPFLAAMGLLDQLQRGAFGGGGQGGVPGLFQGMMLAGLANMLLGPGGAGGGGGGMARTPGGGSPFVDWFGPGDPRVQGRPNGFGGGGGGGVGGLGGGGDNFSSGVAGPTQGQFGLGQNDGSDVAGVLNDSSLTVEDKVCLMLMLIMKKMDQDIEKQAQEINKLQQQQNKKSGGKGGGKGGGGGGGGDKSIDVETMKLKRLIDKRSQMFDMLRQIIDKYNQTAKGVIDTIGR